MVASARLLQLFILQPYEQKIDASHATAGRKMNDINTIPFFKEMNGLLRHVRSAKTPKNECGCGVCSIHPQPPSAIR